MHTHRHTFEVVQIGDKKMSGLMRRGERYAPGHGHGRSRSQQPRRLPDALSHATAHGLRVYATHQVQELASCERSLISLNRKCALEAETVTER
jgi:hypothetical protein